MTSGELIKIERKEKKLTQKQLGKLCGLSETQIGQYENGYRKPKLATLKKIAKALNIPYFELLDTEKDEFPNKTDEIYNDENKAFDELLKKRNIYNITKKLEQLGYVVGAGTSSKIEKSDYRCTIILPYNFTIHLSDQELIALEKDCDDYLKFKILEIKNKQYNNYIHSQNSHSKKD